MRYERSVAAVCAEYRAADTLSGWDECRRAAAFELELGQIYAKYRAAVRAAYCRYYRIEPSLIEGMSIWSSGNPWSMKICDLRLDDDSNRDLTGTRCRLYKGKLSEKGYGSCQHKKKRERIHRVAYCKDRGIDIAEIKGMFIMHRCDRRNCYNPRHLRLGSNFDNVDDMMAKGRHGNVVKTRCPKGHPYDEANTYVQPTAGYRSCKTCSLAQSRAKTLARAEAKAKAKR